jgi:hypothetical protein
MSCGEHTCRAVVPTHLSCGGGVRTTPPSSRAAPRVTGRRLRVFARGDDATERFFRARALSPPRERRPDRELTTARAHATPVRARRPHVTAARAPRLPRSCASSRARARTATSWWRRRARTSRRSTR